MHVHTVFAVCLLIYGAFWMGVQADSPVPTVPDRVHALVGSCVVIPCSFTLPASRHLKGRRGRVDVRLRFRGGGRFFFLHSTAFNSEARDMVSREFIGRTSLFGKMADGDCSVKIERVRLDDSHVFEITLKTGDELLWGTPKVFSLDVTETPEAPVISGMLSVIDGQLCTLNCTIICYCPSKLPALQWHWERGDHLNSSEHVEVQTLYPQAHSPILLARLSFTASYQVKPRLRCEVSYPGARAAATTKALHVTFPPKDVKVQVQTLIVQEGGNALLVCSCKADPPVLEYRWSYRQHGLMVHLHQRSQQVRVYNVTRDMKVRCTAENLIGQGVSQLTALNIQYKPIILQLSSTCVLGGLELLCQCSVDSNPRAAVTWSVNGTVPPRDYNTSVTSEDDVLTATMRGYMETPLRVMCFAFNSLGNNSLVLLQGKEDSVTIPLLWMVIPAVVICVVISLIIVLLYCCCKKAGKNVMSPHRAKYHRELGIYQERTPLYINCTEVTHIYTNGSYQLVYQNCTPFFVRSKQVRPIGRIGGERRLAERRRRAERGGVENQMGLGVGREVDTSVPDAAETAIYLEIP
ncbi:sialoadhesin [Thalassophryne amazonica]|uniref:sialoadhesin n=1 Tax=Thalassophryne amazonica TaxID=390379 RepID=UPI001470B45D|nr:sialoadhesin [Thalassophryne amazonica]